MGSDGGQREKNGRNDWNTSRRRLLRAATGLAVTTGLAGCQSGGDGTTTTTATPTTTTSSNKEVSGRIRLPNGDPLTNSLVAAAPPDPDESGWFGTLTDSTGDFTLEVPRRRWLLCCYQVTDQDPSTARFNVSSDGTKFPRDDVPDLYGFADLGPSETNTGTTALDPGHLLEIEVVDQNGDPVTGTQVQVYQLVGGGKIGIQGFRTDSQGRFNYSRDGPGIEVREQIGVGAEGQTQTLDVQSDRSVRIQLR